MILRVYAFLNSFAIISGRPEAPCNEAPFRFGQWDPADPKSEMVTIRHYNKPIGPVPVSSHVGPFVFKIKMFLINRMFGLAWAVLTLF